MSRSTLPLPWPRHSVPGWDPTRGRSAATSTSDTISSGELCGYAEVSYRQLDYWARMGLLVPVVAARGQGSVRRFAWSEVAVARVLDRVMTVGPQRWSHDQALRRVATQVRAGLRGTVEFLPGVLLDLDAICGRW